MREPFPLQWPDGWARTRSDYRMRSKFGFRSSGQVSFSSARRDLLDELDRLGAANAIITSDLPTRHDGLPYANGRSEDPGIAVWFVLPDKHGNQQERVFACDKWRTHAENMQAIAKSIEALRGLDRWGASDLVTRAFAGFNALPPGSGDEHVVDAPVKRAWWEVLGINEDVRKATPRDLLFELAKLQHRKLIKVAHPDAGGTHEQAAELNEAFSAAALELGARP